MATTLDEQIPGWAQQLIKEVTILNERLPNHIDYTERNISDHENRIRAMEITNAALTQIVENVNKITERLEKTESRIVAIERRLWLAIGGGTVIMTAIEIYTQLINGIWSGK